MADLLLGPVVGGLTHKRAFLWGRAAPTPAQPDSPRVLHAWLGSLPDLSDARLAGQSLPLRAEDAYAGVAPLSGLSPDTHYYYSLSLSTEPPSPAGAPYPEFSTFPLPGQPRSFAFAFGSCFCPQLTPPGQIFDALEAQRQQDALRFLLLLGDQIYADDTQHNGLGVVACSAEEYRAVYEHNWGNPSLRRLLANLPAFMAIDDHEVDDDWTWTNSERTQAQIPIWDRVQRWLQRRERHEGQLPLERVQAALQAYWEHQSMHAPSMIEPPELNEQGRYALRPSDSGSLAYEFNFGAAAFFVLDTRTMRVKNHQQQVMLGDGQWLALESWLRRVKDDFPVKFIVTSCSLLYPMWLDIPRDRWSGFPEEQARLLSFLAVNGITGVHFLAGDLHSAHAVSADLYGPQGQAIPIWEYCASPFEQQTNRLSRFTYSPLRGLPLKNQKVHFSIGQHNFGVVRVDFDLQGKAQVRYEVHGRDGGVLGMV